MGEKKLLCMTVFVLAMTLTWSVVQADTVPISNYYLKLYVTSMSYVVDGLDVTYQGNIVNTGQFSVTLDTSYPQADNYLIFEFQDNSTYGHTHMLINCPLFEMMGIPPQKMLLEERGPSGIISVSPSVLELGQWTSIDVTLHGGFGVDALGTFDTGQYFTGWEYRNHHAPPPEVDETINDVMGRVPNPLPENQREIETRRTEEENRINHHGDANIEIKNPGPWGGDPPGPISGNVGYTADIYLAAVPEPSSLALLASAFVLIMLGGKRMFARRKSAL